jgi:hypothetical protein
VRDSIAATAVLLRTRYDIVQELIGHLAGEALTLEIGSRNARMVGVRAGGLQEGEIVFDLIVGGERADDPSGK